MGIKKIKIKRNKAGSIARIVKTTAQLFAEKGYENTTYTEIAKRSNLNISLISRYFGTKDHLLFCSVEHMTKDMQEELKLTPFKPTFEEEIHTLINIIVDKVANDSNKMKAICGTATYNDEFKKKLYCHTAMPEFMSERLLHYYPQASLEMKMEMRTFIEEVHNATYAISYFLCVIFGISPEKAKTSVHYIVENMINGMKYSGIFLEHAAELHERE